MDQHWPDDLLLMSNSVCAGRPSRSARANASHTPIMEMPKMRVLQIFAAWPVAGPAGMDDGLAHLFEDRPRRGEGLSAPAGHEGERGRLRARDAAGDRGVEHVETGRGRSRMDGPRRLDIDGRAVDEQGSL